MGGAGGGVGQGGMGFGDGGVLGNSGGLGNGVIGSAGEDRSRKKKGVGCKELGWV